MSAVSSFIASLLFCNSGDHRQGGVVSTTFVLGRVTSGYAKRMLSVAVSALRTATARDADDIATNKGDPYCKFRYSTSLRTDNLDAQGEEFSPIGERFGVGIETRA
jgi:hypothetical protein